MEIAAQAPITTERRLSDGRTGFGAHDTAIGQEERYARIAHSRNAVLRALYVLAVVKFRKFCVSRHSQSGIDEAARIDAFVLGNRIDRDLHRSGRIGRPGIGRFVRRHAVTALMTEEEARIRRFVGQYEPVVLDRDIALSPVETAEQLHAGLLLRLDDLRPRLSLHPGGHLDRHAALFLAAVRRNRNRDFGRGLGDRHRVAHRVAERQAISPRFEGRARRARLRPDDEGQFIPPPFTGNRGRNRARFELRDLIGLRFRLIVGLVVRTGGETAQRNATQKRR